MSRWSHKRMTKQERMKMRRACVWKRQLLFSLSTVLIVVDCESHESKHEMHMSWLRIMLPDNGITFRYIPMTQLWSANKGSIPRENQNRLVKGMGWLRNTNLAIGNRSPHLKEQCHEQSCSLKLVLHPTIVIPDFVLRSSFHSDPDRLSPSLSWPLPIR